MSDYKYRDGYRPSLKNPQVVGERLQELRDKYGSLTPEIVVKDAKSKQSVLHNAFEWDDSVAAKHWRLHTARHLIRSVVIEQSDATDDIRYKPAFVFIKTEQGPQYQSLARVLSDDELRLQVLNRAAKELDQWTKRYEDYQEFYLVIEQAHKATKRIRSNAVANA
jgi:hypothetical protein